MADDSRLSKWDTYHAAGVCPWENGRPESHVCAYVLDLLDARRRAAAEKDAPITGITCIDMGCGAGFMTKWLREQPGVSTCICVDVSEVALARSKLLFGADAAPYGCAVEWLYKDILRLQEHDTSRRLCGVADTCIDVQTFHTFTNADDAEACARAYAYVLKAGGVVLLLAGNADEPARTPGPATLSADAVRGPFTRAGLQCETLVATRFDPTEAYLKDHAEPPLAWWGVFRKPV